MKLKGKKIGILIESDYYENEIFTKFLPKNDSLIVNILSVIEHSVNNKENVKFPGHC